MSNDLLITPGSRKQEFKDSDGNIDAKIETDVNGNLVITNPGGDISLGDTTADVFIGDGTNNVDIVFEQNGEIRGTSGVTVTLGDSGSNVSMGTDLNLNGNAIVGVSDLTITGDLNITGDINSYNVTDLDVTDKTITLGVGGTATANDTGGIIIDGANAKLTWANTAGKWSMNKALQFDDAATETNQNLGIFWTAFDKEATNDFTDTAYIKHTENIAGLAGSVLEIKSANDNNDGIAFNTPVGSKLKHIQNNNQGDNTYNIYTTEDFATSDFVETAGSSANNVSTALNLTGNINQSGGYFVSNGFQPADNDLDTAWGHQVTTSKNVGIQPFRYQKHNSGGLNQPTTMNDNANWGLNIYSHAQSSSGLYGLQLTGGNSDSQAMFFRRVSDGSFGNWHRFYSTNDFTWQANTLNNDGYVTAPTASNASKVWKTDASGNPDWRDDDNTWIANAVTIAGYVAAPAATDTNKVWKTNASGEPAWRNDANDNTWNANAVDVAGYVAAPTGSTANQVWKTDGSGNPAWRADANTWVANAVGVDGYVAGPVNDATGQNKVWKTDGSGNPAWRDDANTWVANAVSVAGYVAAPAATDANLVWKTDGSGVPAWRADANTTYQSSDFVVTDLGGYDANETATFLREDGTFATPAYTTNTFRTIKVDTTNNGTAETALSASDELHLVGGTNVTLTENNGIVTINSADDDSAYMPKAGGTFTGDVTFDKAATALIGDQEKSSRLLKMKASAWQNSTGPTDAVDKEIEIKLTGVAGTAAGIPDTGWIYSISNSGTATPALSVDDHGNLIIEGNATLNSGELDITAAGTGTSSTALTVSHGSPAGIDQWTADALTAYNATTSYDHEDTDVQKYWARHEEGIITSYMQDHSSGPVLWERFAQLDDSNDHATQGMRDMVFYQYDGAGTAIADMKKPVGKLLTIRTYENSGNQTQLSLDSDGNLTVPGTVTPGGVTFPAAGTATAYNNVYGSAGSLVFKSSSYDNNDSTAVDNSVEMLLKPEAGQNNIGYSHLVLYDGDSSLNKPIVQYHVRNGAALNPNNLQRTNSADFYGDVRIYAGPANLGGALYAQGVFTACQSETLTNTTNAQKGLKIRGTNNIGDLNTRDAFIAASGLHGVSTDRREVFTMYPKPTSSASHYVYQGGSSDDSVAREHIFQADDDNDNTNGMRDMVFYQYSGTGNTANNFSKPNGNLLTIRTHQGSSGHETQLSLNSDGNLTIAGTATIGAYTLPSTGGSTGQVLVYPGSGSTLLWANQSGSTADSTKLPLTGGSLTGDLVFPAEDTATVDNRYNSDGSIIFKSSSWDANDSQAEENICEIKMVTESNNNVGTSHLTFYNGTEAINEPLIVIGDIAHGSSVNADHNRKQSMRVYGDINMSPAVRNNSLLADNPGPQLSAQRISIKPNDEDGDNLRELALSIKGDSTIGAAAFVDSLGAASGLPAIGSTSGKALVSRSAVYAVFPKSTGTEASSYIFAGKTTSESIMREHIFSADNTNDFETTGMRDMVFYEWDGAGSTASDMVAPTGKLLTVRTHDSATAADQKTHLSVSADGTVELFDGDYTIKKPADVTIASTSTNAAQAVLTLDKTTFTSAEVTIQCTDTTPNPDRFEVMKLLIIHNDVDVHFSMSDNIYTHIPLMKPDVTLSNNDITIWFTPDVAGSAFAIKTFARIIA